MCVSVESPTIASDQQPHRDFPLHRCQECGAPMLLMAATEALRHPITLRKTYQCMICHDVITVVAPLFE